MTRDLLAVVIFATRFRRQGHLALVNRQRALGLGVVTGEPASNVILLAVENLEGVDLNVAPASVGLRTLERVLVGVALGQGAVDNSLGARQRRAVVGLGDALGHHDQAHLDGGNRELADMLGHNLVVALLSGVVPADRIRVVALANLGLRAGGHKLRGLVVHQTLDLAALGEGGAVVGLSVAIGGDSQRGRRDLDRAVDLLDVQALGHVLAGGIDDNEVVDRSFDVGGGDVGCRGIRGCTLNGVALRQGADADGSAMGLAIVREGATRSGNHDLLVRLGDGQLTESLAGDLVVALLGGVVIVLGRPRDLVGIGRAANLGDGAGAHNLGRLAVHETRDSGAVRLGKGLAVIGLVGTGRCDRQRGGRDLVLTLDRAGISALARNLDRDGAGVGKVGGLFAVALVHNGVVGTLLEHDIVAILDLRLPLVSAGIVD